MRIQVLPGARVQQAYATPAVAVGQSYNSAMFKLPYKVRGNLVHVDTAGLTPGQWEILVDFLYPQGQTWVTKTVSTGTTIGHHGAHHEHRHEHEAHFKYPQEQRFCWSEDLSLPRPAAPCEDSLPSLGRTSSWLLRPSSLFKVFCRVSTGILDQQQTTTVQGPLLSLTLGAEVPTNWPVLVAGKVTTPEAWFPYRGGGYTTRSLPIGLRIGCPWITIPATFDEAAFSVLYYQPYGGLATLTARLVADGTQYPMAVASEADTNMIQISGTPSVPDAFVEGTIQVLAAGAVVYEWVVQRCDTLEEISEQGQQVFGLTLLEGA